MRGRKLIFCEMKILVTCTPSLRPTYSESKVVTARVHVHFSVELTSSPFIIQTC
jgi:hypothetical protein